VLVLVLVHVLVVVVVVVVVLYGSDDIFGEDAKHLVRRRFPRATHLTLEHSGHVPRLQNSAGFARIPDSFYGSVPTVTARIRRRKAHSYAQ